MGSNQTKVVVNLSTLDANEIRKLIENSIDGEYMEMDEKTVCLFDLSPFQDFSCQTLIIQTCGKIYKSLKTSNELLHMFNLRLNGDHDETCKLANASHFGQKIPYIIGERGIIPSGGYTKKPASWLVLNHIEYTNFVPDKKQVHLYGHENLVLIIPITKEIFEKQVDRTALLVHLKMTRFCALAKAYKYIFREPVLSPRNILSERVRTRRFEEPSFTYQEIERLLLRQQTLKVAYEVLGEDNPYFDDFEKKLDSVL